MKDVKPRLKDVKPRLSEQNPLLGLRALEPVQPCMHRTNRWGRRAEYDRQISEHQFSSQC